MFIRHILGILLVCLGWWSAAIRSTFAQGTPAVTFPSANLNFFAGSTAVTGYSFTVSGPLSVLGLSLYDVGADGFASSGQVGLWNNAGILLAQVTIAAGTSAPIQNGFRYALLTTPIVLYPMQTYVVAGSASGTDQSVFMQRAAAFAPQITYVADRFGPNNAFVYPNFSGQATASNAGDFGGSFLFAVVPEPKSTSLLVLGTLSAMLFARQHIRSKN